MKEIVYLGILSTAPLDSSMGFQYPFVDCT
jgi:hypothetical protein